MDKKQKQYVECAATLLPVRDALEALSGKWRLPIIISISQGNKRFREIERSIPKITTKVIAKELKELEQHRFIKRTVYDTFPVKIEYTLQPYAYSLANVIEVLKEWGINHRKEISKIDK